MINRFKRLARRLLSKVVPGWCDRCPGRNYLHNWDCPRQGGPGRRLWSQDG